MTSGPAHSPRALSDTTIEASQPPPERHPYLDRPNRTLFRLTVPVLFSLVAEPLTGLVDTAFVARLGSAELAALGVGTMALSSVFWIFNFLGISTQTDVARADGRGDTDGRAMVVSVGLTVALTMGLVAGLLLTPATPWIARLLGADGSILQAADTYTSIRWWGAPAILVTITGFGALRGVQRMNLPLWIAVGVNAMNIGLDAVLIFGFGPIPAFGIAGAAWASVAAQWSGAVVVLIVCARVLGARPAFDRARAAALFRAGGDLLLRTGTLTLFILIGTREATRLGADQGAVHQAIRQFWMFTALFLDAAAISGQTLVAYFEGHDHRRAALHVARTVVTWSLVLGVGMSAAMWTLSDQVALLLVPEEARYLFAGPWLAALLFQPLNALTFATDGIHWGTRDFRYLRNATITASTLGISAMYLVKTAGALDVTAIWIVTGGWIVVRVLFGLLRIWPGVGRAPLRA